MHDENNAVFHDRESLPRWTNQLPFVFVQQIVVRAATNHNDDNAIMDAFRGPLFEVFKLLEITRNHETNVTLSDVCFHVENIKRPGNEVLFPEYNCLVLSPANFWRQNVHNFKKDNLLKTIFKHHVMSKFRQMQCKYVIDQFPEQSKSSGINCGNAFWSKKIGT